LGEHAVVVGWRAVARTKARAGVRILSEVSLVPVGG
jgi:hypothetical protein